MQVLIYKKIIFTIKFQLMKKQSTKKFTKEWIELTLCNMVDDILQFMKNGESKEETLKKIKKYSTEIYNSQ